MKLSELKEQIRGIIRERSVKTIQKDYSNVVSDMEKHLELYKKSKGTPEEKKHIGHLKDLTAKKKKLQAELDIAVSNLYKNAELKVDEIAYTSDGKLKPKKGYNSLADYEKEAKKGDFVWVGTNPREFESAWKSHLMKVVSVKDGEVVYTPYGRKKLTSFPQKNSLKAITVQ